METIKVYEIRYENGGLWRVVIENRSQFNRLMRVVYNDIQNGRAELIEIVNAIHNIKDFEKVYKR